MGCCVYVWCACGGEGAFHRMFLYHLRTGFMSDTNFSKNRAPNNIVDLPLVEHNLNAQRFRFRNPFFHIDISSMENTFYIALSRTS